MAVTIKLSDHFQHVHLVGVGGAGMNGIAHILASENLKVTGSDAISHSDTLEALKAKGVKVMVGHHPSHVAGADVVVYSTAIAATNPELQEARRLGIPVVGRAQMLSELMRFYRGIAVAGTHGKTTTTSLIAHLLLEGGLDPTCAIGGVLRSTGHHARVGQGEWFVAEADESDGSFSHFRPLISVITNIDRDHMATFGNSDQVLNQAFVDFLGQLPFYGTAVLCAEDKRLCQVVAQQTLGCRMQWYGWSDEADIWASELAFDATGVRFVLHEKNGGQASVFLPLMGRHNVLNALAACAVGRLCGLGLESMAHALSSFAGVNRRFQDQGWFVSKTGAEFQLYSDYGHHPSEIRAVLEGLSLCFPQRRWVLVFQPHRYSRTKDLLAEFAEALALAPQLVLTEVYAAGEEAIEGGTTADLAHCLRFKKAQPMVVSDVLEAAQTLEKIVNQGDLVLAMGAGSIGKLAENLEPKSVGC